MIRKGTEGLMPLIIWGSFITMFAKVFVALGISATDVAVYALMALAVLATVITYLALLMISQRGFIFRTIAGVIIALLAWNAFAVEVDAKPRNARELIPELVGVYKLEAPGFDPIDGEIDENGILFGSAFNLYGATKEGNVTTLYVYMQNRTVTKSENGICSKPNRFDFGGLCFEKMQLRQISTDTFELTMKNQKAVATKL